MRLLAQSLAEEMRARTGFHSNQVNLHVRSQAKKLDTRELLPHHNLSGMAQSNKVKNLLAQINADGVQVHGKPPRSPLYPAGLQAADHPISNPKKDQPEISTIFVFSDNTATMNYTSMRGVTEGRQ
jgi:hypothetical protein